MCVVWLITEVVVQLKSLTECCCRRKRFYQSLGKVTIDAVMLMALRDEHTCQRMLADLLEMEVFEHEPDLQQQMITTLDSTPEGAKLYDEVCQRQLHIKQLVGVEVVDVVEHL